MKHGRSFQVRGAGFFFLTAFLAVPAPVARAATLHVPSEYPTIAAAIGAATGGDTVQIAPGTYYEAFSISKSVIVRGSGAGETIVDASGGYAPVTLSGTGGSLEDLEVRNAQAAIRVTGGIGVTVRNCSVTSAKESAIRVEQSSRVAIERCALAATAMPLQSIYGEPANGLFLSGVGSSRICRNTISGIVAGRGRGQDFWTGSHAGGGGGAYGIQAAGLVVDSTFDGNLIHGIQGGRGGDGSPTYSNTDGGGGTGGRGYGIEGEFERCFFLNNIVHDVIGGEGGVGYYGIRLGGMGGGGGKAIGFSGVFRDSWIVHSTVHGIAGGHGGSSYAPAYPGYGGTAFGIFCYAGRGSRCENNVLFNTIPGTGGFSNAGQQGVRGEAIGFHAEETYAPLADYNCYGGHETTNVEGFTRGSSSIVADPRFQSIHDSPSGLRLRAGSPCIDSGTDIPWVTRDYGGAFRPARAGYDIGAYEFPGRHLTFVIR